MCRTGARRALVTARSQKSRHGMYQICLETHANVDANPGGWVEKEKLLSPKSLVIPERDQMCGDKRTLTATSVG